ncbi:thiol:disulfide interchange protein DsbD [Melaminivora alkalimesophila]|uniref:Thiol:disulfide interchange protein DsbD n=3 Tax=Melaminivora alkalimesophila TaxID=1165852 RepID=A0A317RAP8_9BURK|nr:protein-disulfide reductase DsbD domain-containing protein [Melaminivora alkalimesophila]PWW45634.1 thiol:disulfide interchange protein DsbD [Melaminivora alkalimesophila]
MLARLLLRLHLVALLVAAAAAPSAPAFAQFQLRLSGGGASADASTVTTPHVRAQLVAHAPEGVGPGRPLQFGLLLEHQPDWHTYWKNPGDSGLPTQLDWQLPAGLDAGEIAWPVPRKFPLGTLANYGYDGRVLLPVPVQVSEAWRPEPLARELEVGLHASWLVCRQECIPEEGRFTLRLPIEGSTATHAQEFTAAAAAAPTSLAALEGSDARVEADALVLRVAGLPAAWQGRELGVFPETPALVQTAATPEQQWQAGVWSARVPLSPDRSESPEPLPLVLTADGGGVRVELPVPGGWPAVAPPATVSPALAAALEANARLQADAAARSGPAASGAVPAPLPTWLAALAGALLGGLLLNLMPCVFPVLAVKVVGFARHGQDLRAQRVGGLAYAAGVVLSFLLLGALMLALRAAGEAVGWGFQLQSPAVVALLAALFTLIGLNLAGVFEFGRMLPSSVAGLQARHPVADAFLTGVLAVAVASPCTAPFMGASLGLTATLPAAQALSIFAALGVGLALPYVLAAWLPAVARALPRPGAWMETLRRLLAFPMFATVVWLVWVLGQQVGIDGVAALLALLVLLALAVWALTLRGRTRAVLAPLAVAAGAWAAWAWTPVVTEPEAAPVLVAQSNSTVDDAPAGIGQWQPWSADLPGRILASGRPVFVDYTAAWCVTCQYNKQTTLADPEVLQDFADRGVALLRADWTRRDPAITASLAELGRSGVPVYVLHAPGRAPVVFSEILGRGELRAALAAL